MIVVERLSIVYDTLVCAKEFSLLLRMDTLDNSAGGKCT